MVASALGVVGLARPVVMYCSTTSLGILYIVTMAMKQLFCYSPIPSRSVVSSYIRWYFEMHEMLKDFMRVGFEIDRG